MTKKNANNNNNNNFFRAFDDIYKIKKIKGSTFNLNHKSVYCFLLNYQMMSGEVFPSYKHIQDNLGIGSNNTIIKYLDELEEMGLVTSTIRKGTSKLYQLVTLDDFRSLEDTEAQQTKKQANKDLHKQPEVKQEQPRPPLPRQIVQEPQKIKQEQPKTPAHQSKPEFFDVDDFLDSCGISDDQHFENHYQTSKIKASSQNTKVHTKHEDGRLCSQCYKNHNDGWDCNNHNCSNYIPF